MQNDKNLEYFTAITFSILSILFTVTSSAVSINFNPDSSKNVISHFDSFSSIINGNILSIAYAEEDGSAEEEEVEEEEEEPEQEEPEQQEEEPVDDIQNQISPDDGITDNLGDIVDDVTEKTPPVEEETLPIDEIVEPQPDVECGEGEVFDGENCVPQDHYEEEPPTEEQDCITKGGTWEDGKCTS